MRYISFRHGRRESFGIVRDGGIVDLGQRLGAPGDLRGYIAAGFPGADALAREAPDLALEEVAFLPVIPRPDMIIMAALNYAEPGSDAPRPGYPVLFLRLPSSQIGHGAPLIRPAVSERLDFEGEMAVIVGRPGRHIPQAQAMEHVAGFACYNDGSVRDWQKHSHQFTPGKNFCGTGAFGPWMVTREAVPDPAALELVTRVNGQEMQRTNTGRMIFDIPWLIAYVSTFAPLVPGDVIVTGTCTGFGTTRKPPVFLHPGDVVEVEIEGLGTLRNPVVAEAAPG